MTELQKLTTNIFSRPDCPEWARWAAVDANGSGHVFDGKPDRGLLYWRGYYVNGTYIGMYDASDWQNSLIERPAKNGSTPVYDDVTAPVYDDVTAPAYDDVTAPAYDDVTAPVYDDVTAPAYYVNTPFGLEVRKITEHYDPYIAAALKYIFRNGQKVYDGLTAKESAIKDLRKAIQNIKFEIEKIENS